jgi:predicted enzyme related to lactoylglutathione lyase
MITAVRHPEPFGIATITNDLNVAREFYATLYPYEVSERVFAGIRYLSIMKDGVTLVAAFERSAANPITGTIPILKVDSVGEYIGLLQSLGGSVIIPGSTCPCTTTSFALCTDKEGNQFIIKEPSRV